MKINYQRQYRTKFDPARPERKGGVLVFVYGVEGKPEELKAFKKSKGDNYKEDKETKTPLFFTTRLVADGSPLIKTDKGEFVPDTSREDQMLNLLGQGYSHEIALTMLPGKKSAATPADADQD